MLKALAITVFVFALLACPIAFIRVLRARTRLEYLKSAVLFIVPIVIAFELARRTGLLPGRQTPPTSEAQEVYVTFAQMPRIQLALVFIACGVWLVGANILFHRHAKRLGRTLRTLNPLEPPFKDFNAAEWILPAALVVFTLGLGLLAASL